MGWHVSQFLSLRLLLFSDVFRFGETARQYALLGKTAVLLEYLQERRGLTTGRKSPKLQPTLSKLVGEGAPPDSLRNHNTAGETSQASPAEFPMEEVRPTR